MWILLLESSRKEWTERGWLLAARLVVAYFGVCAIKHVLPFSWLYCFVVAVGQSGQSPRACELCMCEFTLTLCCFVYPWLSTHLC